MLDRGDADDEGWLKVGAGLHSGDCLWVSSGAGANPNREKVRHSQRSRSHAPFAALLPARGETDGSRAMGASIPANSVLVFKMEMLSCEGVDSGDL